MHYPGPSSVDFEDVRALNRAFLSHIRREDDRIDAHGLRDDLKERFLRLSKQQLERLAATPFLLMSFRENDRGFWERLHTAEPQEDLFSGSTPGDDEARLIAAGLGFAWQLARLNPYSLRLVCGASLYWCERLCEVPLVDVLERAARRTDVLVIRAAADAFLWEKLLFAGVCGADRIRRAAHLSALQMLLTGPEKHAELRIAPAACRSTVPWVQSRHNARRPER